MLKCQRKCCFAPNLISQRKGSFNWFHTNINYMVTSPTCKTLIVFLLSSPPALFFALWPLYRTGVCKSGVCSCHATTAFLFHAHVVPHQITDSCEPVLKGIGLCAKLHIKQNGVWIEKCFLQKGCVELIKTFNLLYVAFCLPSHKNQY